jgi:hypothetical protein
VKRLAVKVTYANVMATVALFLALGGGTVYAATKMLPKESVGSAQLEKGAVTAAKLSKAAKAKLRGPAGPVGATGPQGAPGKEGAPGKDVTATMPLPAGATETGVFSAAGGGAPAFLPATANFVQPLATTLPEERIEVLRETDPHTTHCPAVGHAAPGYFCAYTTEEFNSTAISLAADPETGHIDVGRNGVLWFFQVHQPAEGSYAYGTWAVTAP